MIKTLDIHLEDLVELLKEEIWAEQVSHNPYGTANEDSYLSGINEGIDRAYRVLADFHIKGYIKAEADK
jgi:hypothetical protein